MKQLFLLFFGLFAGGLQAQPKLIIQSKAPCPFEVWVQIDITTHNIVVAANSSETIYLQSNETPCIIVVHDGLANYIKAYHSCATGTDTIVPVPQCVDQFSPISPIGDDYLFQYWLQP